MRAGIAETPSFFFEGQIRPGIPALSLITRLTG
jgi:hypothetical protein